jgi:glucose-6-phosphate 1-dehydrogenase
MLNFCGIVAAILKMETVEKVESKNILLGQYVQYIQQAADEKDNTTQSMKTPTYASVLLKILSPRWHGIPGDGNSLGFI